MKTADLLPEWAGGPFLNMIRIVRHITHKWLSRTYNMYKHSLVWKKPGLINKTE